MSEIKTRDMRAGKRWQGASEIIEAMQAEINELRAALAERDANLTALETHNTMLRACIKGMIKVADRKTDEFDAAKALLAAGAAGAAPVPEGWRSAVAMAYGHLWHVNNEPMAPIPLRSEESASYAARKLLRDLMTTKERGEAINAVQKLLAAAPKDAP